MDLLKTLSDSVIKGDAKTATATTQQALDAGIAPIDILNKGLVAAMDVVGEKFKNNEFYVPEMLIAARAMKSGLSILRPVLAETGVKPIGTAVLGTVKGDLHDIGKNLVGFLLEGAGLQVIDLGVDVSAEQFLAAAKEHDAQLIGLSALLTTTMENMRDVMKVVNASDYRKNVKVMVGGAPLTQNFADDIGADGFADDAAGAVDLGKRLLAS